MRRPLLVALILAFAPWTALSQSGEQPRFRSGISILQLGVSAIDSSGKPARDLRADDFVVEINGRPRKVLFARFAGADEEAVPPGESPLPSGSIVSNTRDRAGRAVVFVIDLESIRAGNEKGLLDTAAQLVDSLSPDDAVAVVPVPGTVIDLTRDRARVSAALKQFRATNILPTYEYNFTLEEALAFERRDRRVKEDVMQRECDAAREKARIAMGLPPICPEDLERETRERLRLERLHVQAVLTAVSNVAERLSRVDAPRTIVLVSGGLAFEPEGLTWFRQAERTIRQAGVTVYAIQVHHSDVDASVSRQGQNTPFADTALQTGLANVATISGGAFFAGVGRAEGVFERVRSEIAYSYLLGIEAAPEDAAIELPKISVKVSRPGINLRVARHPGTELTDPQQRLRNLVSQPIDVVELPVSATVATVRGEEPSTLKAIIAAEIGRGIERSAPMRYAVMILQDGKPAFETNGTAAEHGDAARVVTAMQLRPGQYRLRLAAVDGTGRAGSIEMPVSIGLRAAGDLQASDLTLAMPALSFTPAFDVPRGTPIAAAVELYSQDPERFAGARVHLQVRRAGNDSVIATSDAPLAATDLIRRQVASASIATSDFAPSEYSVSAVISLDGQPVGMVTRNVRVAPPAPASATPAATPEAAPSRPAEEAPPPAAPASRDPALDDVVGKLGEYVLGYGERASLVVAVEKYTQHVQLAQTEPLRPRRIVAEFALVKTSGKDGWIGFRDVVEVDGEPVQDRRDRLMKLFTDSSAPLPEATRIANESARYNVGPISRNFNVPTMALLVFRPENLARFTFTRKGKERIDGVETVEIDFREIRRPTLVMTRAGKDVPMEGTLWVVPADGTVVRTRLRMRGFADAISMTDPRAPSVPVSQGAPASGITVSSPPPSTGSGSGGGQAGGAGAPAGGASGSGGAPSGATPSGGGSSVGRTSGESASRRNTQFEEMPEMTRLESRADIEVTYKRDEKLGMWLPLKMSEHYEGPIPRVRSAPVVGITRTLATYVDYRQFGVTSTIKVPEK